MTKILWEWWERSIHVFRSCLGPNLKGQQHLVLGKGWKVSLRKEKTATMQVSTYKKCDSSPALSINSVFLWGGSTDWKWSCCCLQTNKAAFDYSENSEATFNATGVSHYRLDCAAVTHSVFELFFSHLTCQTNKSCTCSIVWWGFDSICMLLDDTSG